MKTKLRIHYMCGKKKLAKLFEFLSLWLKWCRTFDENMKHCLDKMNK